MSELIFFVNGKKIIKPNPDPTTLLAEFLRHELKLTGTKIACGEGGCGACTVLVSRFDRSTSRIVHSAVNSCLLPLCSLHGLAVTTVEAVGSVRTKMHPIQERLVAGHGVQCGYCSPGFVMSMFSLLRNNPEPSELDIEYAIQGNLCRCTGYRPILDAFRTFAKGNNGCPMGASCCQNKDKQEIAAKSDSVTSDDKPDSVTQEIIFPNELQLSDELDRTSLTFGSAAGVIWRRPATLAELLALKKQHPQAVLAAGSSSTAFLLKSRRGIEEPVVFIATTAVEELRVQRQEDSGLFLGALTSVTELETLLSDITGKQPDSQTRFMSALLNIIKVFGSKQIRNVATLGGNLALASPSADVNVVLSTGLCTVELASVDNRRQVAITDFFTGDKHTCMNQDEIVVGVRIPFTTENEYYASFKQSPRRDMSASDVNAAIGLCLSADGDAVERLSLSVGGVAMTGLKRIGGVGKMAGKKWDRQLIESVLPEVLHEVNCQSADVETNRFRMLSMQGFLLKFYLEVCEKLARKQELSESDHLYLDLKSKRDEPVHSGVQVYHLEKPVSETDSVGQPLAHRWAKQCTTGEAVYTDDIPAVEGELYVALVKSEKPRARIVNVDPSAALAIPGVVGYLDHTSIPGSNVIGELTLFEVFAETEVHHIGQPIGAIVANSQTLAKLGVSQVKIEYEELPAILTIEDAIAHNSYHSFFFGMGHLQRGDVEAAFKSATHVVEGELRIGGQEHFYMETSSARVVPKIEDGEMEVFIGNQHPAILQEFIAHALHIDSNKITVRVKRMGGSFGGKELRIPWLAIPAALAANKYGRPARCVYDRQEDMQMTGHRRPHLFKYKVGFMDTGKIVAVDADVYANDGYCGELAYFLMAQTVLYSDNCYAIPNMNIRGHLCKTNLQARAAMRGAGKPQAVLFSETILREVADYLKVPALQIQQLNMLRTGELASGNVPIEGSLGRCFDDVLKQSNYVEELGRIEEFNKKSKHIKRGIAAVPIRMSPCLPMPLGQAGALVHIYLDGSVLVTHGGVESGQGLHTKMLQVASRALEVPIESIHLSETSTSTVPNAPVTAGSSGSDQNGMAVMNACLTLNERLKPYKLADPNGSWKSWVHAAYHDGVSLSSTGHWRTPFDSRYNWQTDEGQDVPYYTYGAGVTQVELDCLTGRVTIPRVDIVMDVGKSLNPAIDVGQIEGSFVMGLGLFTVEDHRYNDEGRLVTLGTSKYFIPTVSSIPLQMNVTLLKDAGNPHAVYSSKGIGEPALLVSGAVFIAIKEAIKAARLDAGLPPHFNIDSPATVQKILLATHSTA